MLSRSAYNKVLIIKSMIGTTPIFLQLYYDTVDGSFSSPFTYSINTTDEGYDEHRYPTEISNVIGYNSSAALKTG